MADPLFDYSLRANRRDRAFRSGVTSFLHERAFEDILERLGFISRGFESVLMVGCMDPGWRDRLESAVGCRIDIVEPGPLFAEACGARCVAEDRMDLPIGQYDLCVAAGTLDTVNDLPAALMRIRLALRDHALLIGAMAGGETLPRLRLAMRASDAAMGRASPHVHPRVEPSALAGLLSVAGFVDPVVDVDRVRVAYSSFGKLVNDLRSMGATNMLAKQSRTPLTRSARALAEAEFTPPGTGERTTETFELLHFAGWTSQSAPIQRQG